MSDSDRDPAVAEPVNIVTMKWGDRYGPDFVNRLYRACCEHLTLPFNFVCFTDDTNGVHPDVRCFPIPDIELPEEFAMTGWRKLVVFQPGLPISGPSLFMDLDLVVLGSLDPFFSFAPGKIPIIHNWTSGLRRLLGKRPEVGNSSIFRFSPNEHTFVYEQFEREKARAPYEYNTEQAFLSHCIRPHMVYWPDSWTRSFKRHCRPVFPLNLIMAPHKPTSDTRVLVFHGRPDPDEAVGGFQDGKIRHLTRRAPWLDAYMAGPL